MGEISNSVDSQSEEFKKVFNDLYLDCIINDQPIKENEYYLMASDLGKLKKKLLIIKSSKEKKININFKSASLLNDIDLNSILATEINDDEIKLIEDNYISCNSEITNAVLHFDSYLKVSKREKSKNRNDILIKILIALVSASATIFAIWLTNRLKSNKVDKGISEIEKKFITKNIVHMADCAKYEDYSNE